MATMRSLSKQTSRAPTCRDTIGIPSESGVRGRSETPEVQAEQLCWRECLENEKEKVRIPEPEREDETNGTTRDWDSRKGENGIPGPFIAS
ncbi:hypothetical protein NDU88_003655 [Pleurodeles waltl]|uniref:Uncharacterized protein n=1 Tax=Pleurodeles waltl TaxID=8319 RepID=A0AAV7M593_PLEWA|nr:hypothetical protein NDU88_003655 [Pleurodeles waltl]